MIVVRRVKHRNQYTNHLTAQFGFYDWVGRKGGDVLEWQINNFQKRNPQYYNNPDFKNETDEYINRVNRFRADPQENRAFGKRIAGIYGKMALGIAATGAVVGAAMYFTRKRKTKNGKVVVERVKKR